MLRKNAIDRHATPNLTAANIYHPANPPGAYGLAVMRPTFTALLREAGVALDKKRILDLGCGTGSWMRFMAELRSDPCDIVGVDCNHAPLAFAQRMSPRGMSYVQADMADAFKCFRAESFDLITAFVSFMFLRDMTEVTELMRGVNRLVSEQGYFFISEVNERHDSSKPYSGFRGTELARVITATGFNLLASRGVFKRFFGVPLLNSYYRVSYRNMFLMPLLERLLPGSAWYTFMLFRKAASSSDLKSGQS